MKSLLPELLKYVSLQINFLGFKTNLKVFELFHQDHLFLQSKYLLKMLNLFYANKV